MEQFYNNDFRKVVVYNSIPYALHNLHTSKCKSLTVVDLTMLAYENWQNAIKFAGANSSDLLLALKPGLRKNKQKTLEHLYVATQGRDHCNVLDVCIETRTSWLESLCACITLSIVSSA